MIAILIYHLIVLGQLYIVCRNKTVSLKELVQTFAVGATAAVLGNFLIQGIAVRFIGSHIAVYTVGPVAEELLKISFVVFLLFKTRFGKTTSIEDGLLLGAAIGAGYGFTEDSVRAVGLGFTEMVSYFPGFDLKNIFTLLTTWLPSEREGMGAISYYNIFIAGHLLWTALAGVGFSIALKLPARFKWKYLIPLFLLIWVTVDHSLCNNNHSMLSFVHGWYGYGLGIRYALTVFLILAVIGDELILRRKLVLDEGLLIPGEKKRTVFSELLLTLTSWKFGKRYWCELMDYFKLRRQLGFMIYSGEKIENFIEMLKKRRRYVIASAHLLGKHKNLGIPPGIISLWHGPRPDFFKFNWNQKMWWSFMILIIIFGIFNTWLFLFSVYLPESIVRGIYQSSLFPIFGILGYGVALFELAIFYIKKLWRNPQEDIDDRIKPYSHFVLINSSGVTMIFSLPFFIGQHFLLIDKFLWGQLARFFEFLKEARKWIGGPLSAGIGAIPIVGNVQSGVNAAFGYDYVSDEPIEGFDRVMAALGAIPLAGNAVRSGWWAARSARYVRINKVVERLKKPIEAMEEVQEIAEEVMDKIEKTQTVKDYVTEAYGKVRDELQELNQTQAKQLFEKRDGMFKQWSNQGGLKKTGEGTYQLSQEGSTIDVYSGKTGTAKLNLNHSLPDTGQVSVDHKSQSIVLDTIGGKSTGEIKMQTLALQKKFPEYTILRRNTHADGFTVTDVISPNGTRSSFYSVPVKFRSDVGVVGAVSSR